MDLGILMILRTELTLLMLRSTSKKIVPEGTYLFDLICHPYAGSHANLLCIVPI
jgi:hypothetical protein